MTGNSGASRRLGRRPALDGVRGIAILLVVASHAAPNHYVTAGLVGVAMFFALSGYLITRLLLEEYRRRESVSLAEFYRRRAARLLPALLVFLVAMLAVGLTDPVRAGAVMVYLANVPKTLGLQMGVLGHTWSLSIEEQFYAVFPVLLLLGVRRAGHWLPWLVLVAAAASLAWRCALWASDADAYRVYFGTGTNAGLILGGCALALFAPPVSEAGRPKLVGAALMLAVLLPLTADDTSAARTWLPVVGAAVGIIGIQWGISSRVLGHPVLTYFGRRSYALYLWHFPLLWVILPRTGLAGWAPVAACVAVSLLLAEASWRLVERPCQRWIRSREADEPEGRLAARRCVALRSQSD